MDGVSGIAVAQVILDQPEIVSPIRQSEAAGCRSMCGWTGGKPARFAAVAIR
jgi:hypothetical protein